MRFHGSLAERSLQRLQMRRTVVVEGQRIPVTVTPAAQLRFLKLGRWFDDGLVGVAERHVTEDAVVWDIGANVGVFTFASAQLAKRGIVVAVEPDQILAGVLRRTAKLGCYSNRQIQVLPVAASSSVGFATLNIARRGRAGNFLSGSSGSSQTGGVSETCLVPTTTLDVMLESFAPPSLVKVDVEGSEPMVFAGADELLSRHRPLVYTEVWESLAEEIGDLFSYYGYAPFDSSGARPLKGPEYNTLFVPKERRMG